MENSHKRMVMELEEKHRRELQSLKIEKDNELAEETKATLSGEKTTISGIINSFIL
jgi:hypothetical protein